LTVEPLSAAIIAGGNSLKNYFDSVKVKQGFFTQILK
jgi:hypothetical protein